MQAIHVKNTWGSHCDKLIFMSTQEDPHLGAVKLLGAEEGRQGLWGKTKRAFKYVYENHFDEYEWFMKADDDTFVVVENLKEVLSNHSTNDPIAFGHNFKYLGVREGRLPSILCVTNTCLLPGLPGGWGRICFIQRISEEICGARNQQCLHLSPER